MQIIPGMFHGQETIFDEGFERSRRFDDDINAFAIYSLGGAVDPKAPIEAAAYRTGPGWFGYVGGFARASMLGMFVAGTLGWFFDPLDLREGSFSQDYPETLLFEYSSPEDLGW
jgi:hypothetical protein